ncbi:MAG: hypothetical protein WCH05_01980 [Chlorobiaceae bacterium]
MSLEQAECFIEKLKSDEEFRERAIVFLQSEGFSCTVDEVLQVQWREMLKSYRRKRENSDASRSGYEYWVG